MVYQIFGGKVERPKLPTARLVDDSFGVTVSDGGQGVLHDLAKKCSRIAIATIISLFMRVYHIFIITNTYRYALCINACIYYNYIYKII